MAASFLLKKFATIAIFDNQTIFSMAREVYKTLKEEEHELMTHLESQLKRGSVELVDPTLFSEDIVVEYEFKRADLWKRYLNNKL